MKKVLLVFPGLRMRDNEGSKHRLNSFIDVYANENCDVTTLAFVKDWPWGEGVSRNPKCRWIFFPYILPSAFHPITTAILSFYMKICLLLVDKIIKFDIIQMELSSCNFGKCRTNKTKYIVDFHGDSYYERIETGDGCAEDWYSKRILRKQKESILNTDFQICVTENLKKQLELNTGLKISNYSIVSCGVDLSRFYNTSKITLDFRKDLSNCLVVGYCGGLHKWQNVDKILDIVIKMRKFDNRIFFMFFTSGDVSKFENLLNTIGEDNYLLKSLKPEEVPAYLKFLDAGFLIRDNLILNIVSSPTKIGEYLAAGAALICTPFSGDYKNMTNENNCFEMNSFSEDEIEKMVSWLWKLKNRNKNNDSLSQYTFENQFKRSKILNL